MRLSGILALTLAGTAGAAEQVWQCREVSIGKVCTQGARAGEIAGCRIIVTNSSQCNLKGARIVDRLPDRVSYVDASPNPSWLGPGERSVVWEGDVMANQSYRVEMVFKIDSLGGREITNEACIVHPWIDGACSSWTLWVEEGERE